MKLWIVGKTITDENDNLTWEFSGVFDTEESAKAACLTEDYFVGPALLNEEIPDTSLEWEGSYRPVEV